MTKLQIVLFSIVHTVSVLLLPLLLSLLGGCMEPELVNKPGPEIPCADVETALNASAQGPWTFQVGEFVHQQETAAPVNQQASTVGDIAQLVLEVTPQADYTVLRIEQTVSEGTAQQDTSEGRIAAPGTFTLCGTKNADTTVTETYHNLKIDQITMDVPMAPGETCDARYTNCQLHATKFVFDKIVTIEGGEQLPVHLRVVTSNEVPYLSRILDYCYTYPFETNGTRIPVTRCTTVRNFKFSSN